MYANLVMHAFFKIMYVIVMYVNNFHVCLSNNITSCFSTNETEITNYRAQTKIRWKLVIVSGIIRAEWKPRGDKNSKWPPPRAFSFALSKGLFSSPETSHFILQRLRWLFLYIYFTCSKGYIIYILHFFYFLEIMQYFWNLAKILHNLTVTVNV